LFNSYDFFLFCFEFLKNSGRDFLYVAYNLLIIEFVYNFMCIDRSVYGFRTSGFGDVWAQVNYMLHYPPLIGVNPVVGGYDLTSVIRMINSELKHY
jgi:hypothetical protein